MTSVDFGFTKTSSFDFFVFVGRVGNMQIFVICIYICTRAKPKDLKH